MIYGQAIASVGVSDSVFFFVFFVCFFSIVIQLKSRKWKTKLRLTSNKQSLTWLVLTPAPLVNILSGRDYFYTDNLLYPHIYFLFNFFFFFFSSSQLHGKKYGIHRLGKPSVNFRKRGILLQFSRVFRS